jgi:integrase
MVQPLYIPPSKRGQTGLTVYCNRCKATITDICKETGQTIRKCKFGEAHKFKGVYYLPNEGNKRVTRIINTRNIYEAIQKAAQIEKEIKEGTFLDNKKNPSEQNQETPVLLIHCFAKYISYLHGEGVPSQFQKERTQAHIKDIEHAFILFMEAIKEARKDWEQINIDDLNDEIIGHIYDYFEAKNYSARTRNKYYSYGVSFLKWWQDQYYPIRNWFSRIPRHEEVHNPQSIPYDEFENLLEIITPETGIKQYPSKSKVTRNYYKPYLKSAIKLGLLTGLRREELINLTWNNVQFDEDNQAILIKVEDYKSNRIRNRIINKKYKFVPISIELQNLLSEMRQSVDMDEKNFILAPEVQTQRTRAMSDSLSRGFSHYYVQLETGKSLTFKSLRKSYITAVKQYALNLKYITGHSENAVIEKHYIDGEQMAISMKNFIMFPQKDKTRDRELNVIRKNTIQANKELEK